MLFFALYPPCLAAMIMVRVQTGSTRWMLFSILFPTALGLAVAGLTHSLGRAFSLSGVEAFTLVYLGLLATLIPVSRLGGRRGGRMPPMARRP